MGRTILLLALLTTNARAEVGIFTAAGYLGSPGGNGAAVSTGVRVALGSRVAFSFDLGYGLMTQRPGIQDRWWLMPAMAWVLTAGPVTIDLGLGVGAGTSSSFASVDELRRDQTVWAFQLAPAVRGHARASLPLWPRLALFTRLDTGALLLDLGGFREGDHRPELTDATWANLWLGVQFSL